MSEAGRIIERSNDGWTFRYWVSDRGTTHSNWECERRFESAIWAVSRWFSRTVRTRTTTPSAEDTRDQLESVRWKLEKLSEHTQMMLTQLDELAGNDRKQERIAKLREIVGRTPEEAATFLTKAEELEKKL